jgi:hypothetical protein
MKDFEVIHNKSSKKIKVFFEYDVPLMRHFIAFGVIVKFEIRKDIKVLVVNHYNIKKAQKAIETSLDVKLANTKSDVCIQITDETWEQHKLYLADWEKEVDKYKKTKTELEAQQPTYFVMFDFLDYGDYRITYERYIRKMRKALQSETNDKQVISYSLSDSRIGDRLEEWENDFKSGQENTKTGFVNTVDISDEVAQKWINYHQEVFLKESEAKEQERKQKEEKIAALKLERENKFKEAKETNKPVILEQYTCHEDDLPKHMREDESDMVTVYVYAMPDGSEKEEISHCY